MTLTKTKPVILCVDDEPPVLSALQRMLRNEPYEVLVAETPHEALQLVRSRHVDAVIADHRMADVTGAELLRRIREISPGTARVLLTGYPDTQSILGRAQAGIQRLIMKPWNDDDLRYALRELLEDSWIPPRRPAISRVETGTDLLETVLRVDGTDRTTNEIRLRLLPHLRDPETARRGLVLFLDALESLNDPPVPFLRTIAETVEAEGVSATLADASGLAHAILDRRGPKLEIVAPVARPRRAAVLGPRLDIVAEALRIAGHSVESLPSSTGVDLVAPDFVLVDLDLLDALRPMGAAGRDVVGLCMASSFWDRATLDALGVARLVEKPYGLMEVLRAFRKGTLPE